MSSFVFYYSVTVTLMKVKGIKIKYLYYVFPNITYLNLFLEFLIRKMQNVTTLSFINTFLFPSTSTIILMFDLICKIIIHITVAAATVMWIIILHYIIEYISCVSSEYLSVLVPS